jgi:hypothetical protein
LLNGVNHFYEILKSIYFLCALKLLSGIYERKRPLGRARGRCEDHIRMDLRKIGREGVDCMYLAKDRDQCWAVVNMVMNIGFNKRRGI